MEGYKKLETIGKIDLYLEEASRDIVLAINTDIGVITAGVTPERACHLGISLIRESGKRYVFTQAETKYSKEASAKKETSNAENESTSPGGNGVPSQSLEPFDLYSGDRCSTQIDQERWSGNTSSRNKDPNNSEEGF